MRWFIGIVIVLVVLAGYLFWKNMSMQNDRTGRWPPTALPKEPQLCVLLPQ